MTRDGPDRLAGLAARPGAVRLATAAAVVVAMAFAFVQGDVINRDGIIYVRAAQAYLDGGLRAAMEVYNWPAYPVLIAAVMRVGGVTPETGAGLVNGCCFLVLADAFVRVAHRLDGADARPWVPALVLLALPALGHRLEIYRDWGYLAFSLLACVPLLRFWQAGRARWGDALLWFAAMLVALAFRVEAAAVIALTPPLLLLRPRPWPERLRGVALLVAVVLGPAVLLALAFGVRDPQTLGKLVDLLVYADLSRYLARYDEMAAHFAASVLNKYSDDAAGFMLGAGIAAMLVRMVLANLGPLLLVLFALAVWQRRWRLGDGYRLVGGLLAAAVLVLGAFLFWRVITVERYALFGSLLLMLFVSHGVAQCFEPAATATRAGRWRAGLALAGLGVAVLVNVTARPDAKEYLREAGAWLAQTVPGPVAVVANDERLLYYARRAPGPKLDRLDKVREALQAARPPYYAALRFNDGETARVRALVGVEPVRVFASRRAAERAEIYYIPAAP